MEQVKTELEKIDVQPDAVSAIFEVVALSDVDDLSGLLGADNEVICHFRMYIDAVISKTLLHSIVLHSIA